MAPNDTVTKAGRRWIVRTGSMQRNVWLLRAFRLFEAAPKQDAPLNRYQLAYGNTLGREFALCPEMSDDEIQSLINKEADEVQMDDEIKASGGTV